MPTSSKEIIYSNQAPKAIGPYSIAVRIGEMVFTAGQIGLDPRIGELVPGGIEAETRQVMTNLRHVLEAAGCTFENVVKTTVFLRDMKDFPAMNAIYGEFFQVNPPARSTIQAAALPKGAAIEIEAVAVINH